MEKEEQGERSRPKCLGLPTTVSSLNLEEGTGLAPNS